MTVRELPCAEWPRLDGTELGSTWPLLQDGVATVIVVEDAGEIVGTWAILPVVHAEGLGIASAYQCRAGVIRLLLREGAKVIRRLGASSFVTAARTEDVRGYVTRMGGVQWPLPVFTVPLNGRFDRVAGTKENDLCQPD